MKRFSLLLAIHIFLLGCSEPYGKNVPALDKEIFLASQQVEFSAGEDITLFFEGENTKNLLLVIQNGWGTTILYPNTTSKQLGFTLPNFMAKKAGWVNWQLKYQENEVLKGDFLIKPSSIRAKNMETYVGPTAIFADGRDQTMAVVLPQDKYGNPMPDGSPVVTTLKTTGNLSRDILHVENMFAYKYITAGKSKGTYFIGTHFEDQVSKEFTVGVLPTLATDFSIEINRTHVFADGNQIVSFSTTPIKDENGNIVADGTIVNFLVEDDLGNYLRTIGQTISGVAIGKLLHPERPSHWVVKANIEGISNSNTLEVDFEEAFSDFPVQFSENGRQLLIGPIQSYMQQLIPDGLLIKVKVQNQDGRTEHVLETTSRKGIGIIDLPENFNINTQSLKVTVGGRTKQIDKESK